MTKPAQKDFPESSSSPLPAQTPSPNPPPTHEPPPPETTVPAPSPTPEPDEEPSSTRRSCRLSKKPRVEYEGLDSEHVSPPRPLDSDTPPGTLAKKPRLGSTEKTTAKKKTSKKKTSKKGPAKKKKKGTRRSPHTMKAIKTYFDKLVCFDVSQLYRRAVYDNTEAGPEAQSLAVKSVLWHNLDRPDATTEERKRYHEFCNSSWCDYQQWVASNPPEFYVRLHDRAKDGTQIPWKGGHYARLDLDYPDAFQGVQDIFETIGCITLMKRCGKKVTQNLNESVHA